MPRLVKVIFTALLFSLLSLSQMFALEYEAGEYRLEISEISGRYVLFHHSGDQWNELFFSENVRTSSISLKYNDSVIRIEEGKDFIVSIHEYDDTVVVQYSSQALRIDQRFSFVESSDGSVEAVAVDYSLVNLGNDDFEGELRLIFDTVLGEQSASHFSTSANQAIRGEYAFSPNSAEPYIVSSDGNTGFMLTLATSGASPARRVVAANWKRLTESPWDYEVVDNRNFNLLPFSINDSALAVFFGPTHISAQQQADYRFYLAAVTPEVSAAARLQNINSGRAASLPGAEQGDLSGNQGEDLQADETEGLEFDELPQYSPEQLAVISPFLQDIETIDALIRQIDSLMQSRATLSESQVQALEEILETILENMRD